VKKLFLMLAGSVILSATTASAHHSFAMFDMTKSTTLKGAVKELQWTNPHIWVEVMVSEGAGKPQLWSLEGGNVAVMKRSGWSRDSLKPGDQVTVVVRPAKAAGERRAMLLNVTLADGRTLTSRGGGVTPTNHIVEEQK
jgi:hypothetical protein